MRKIGRLIGGWTGTACLAVLDAALFVVLLALVALSQLISLTYRGIARAFGASPAPSSPLPPARSEDRPPEPPNRKD